MEEGRSAFKISTGTPVGKRSSGRPRSRWEDNIRIYLKSKVRGIGLIRLRMGFIRGPL